MTGTACSVAPAHRHHHRAHGLPGRVQRLAGYRYAIDTYDPALVAAGDYTRAGGAAATERLLRQAPDLDAIFAASDMMATVPWPPSNEPGTAYLRLSLLPDTTTRLSPPEPGRS
jgi:hypothetical protein